MLDRLRHFWRAVMPRDEVSGRVRSALVATLYQSPASLAIGALVGSVNAVYIARNSSSDLIDYIAGTLVAIALWRVVIQFAFRGKANSSDDMNRSIWLEYIFEVGAWSFALMLSLLAGATVHEGVAPELIVISVATAIGYGAAIAARNAGRPVLAVGQTLLSTLPMTISLAISGIVAFQLLAVTFGLYMLTMVGITTRTFATIRDSFIRAEAQANIARKMETFATTDTVTGLMNRAGLTSHFDKKRIDFAASQIAVFWIDLDRFKEVNDTLGHPVGDRLLVTVASRLREICEENDIICRFGGDEFIVIKPDIEADAADRFSQSLLAAIAKPVWIENGNINVTASVGIALSPLHGNEGDTLMKRADMALYQSKMQGRNQYCFYQPDMTYALTRKKEIEGELRKAIGRDELKVHYQPIIEFETGKIAAFEALVRWEHPVRGALSPDEFIPIAESTGLILTIGNWIVGEACRAAAQWPDDIPVCVNVSPIQMRAPGAALGFLNALRAARIGGHRLELEVTETIFLDESPEILDFIETVEAADVRMTLDDFGTGYSSLSYLYKHDFCKIKVDRSFVTGQILEQKAMAIVRAIAGLARDLDIDVIAEGIETEEEQIRVYEAGCTHGQGYLYSPAVPADQALRLLSAGKEDGAKVA